MSVFKANMESLQKRYPELADRVKHLSDDGTVKIIRNTTSTRTPSCTVTDETKKEWLIHDRVNPVGEATSFVNAEVGNGVESAHIIVVFGLGLGYEFEALFNKYSGPMTQFIVIENNIQLFKKYISTKSVGFGDSQGMTIGNILECPSVNFLIETPFEQIYNILFDILHHTSGSCFTTFHCIEHPVLIRFNKNYYKPIIGELARACYDIKGSFGNDPMDSWSGMDHMLQNTDMIAENPGITPLKDKFSDVPAIIVATGPSLNKNIHLIKQMSEHCVLFAADASVNTFMKYKEGGIRKPIIPHMVTSLERSDTTHKHFKQVDGDSWEQLKDTFLCACPVVKPDVYENWHGKNVIMYRDFAHFHWLHTEKGTLHTGKSVTNLAWKVAEFMGCNPIILVGQDLAFAGDGQTHADGADHARNGLENSPLIKNKMKCMGYHGKEVETLDTWYGMKKRFEYDIAKNPELMCINATEGGARIEGTYQMTLQEVLDTLSVKVDIKKRLDELLHKPTIEEILKTKEVISKHVDEGYKYLNNGIQLIDNILDGMEKFMYRMNREDISDGEFREWIQLIETQKNELLKNEYAWFTMMHVMQSWLMGRDNVFRSIPSEYDGMELKASKSIRLYEMFRGLKILFKLVFNGTEEMYYSRGKQIPKL